MDDLLTTRELLAELKISRSRLYRLLASGEIQAYHIGKGGSALRFKRADVQALLRQREASTPQHGTLPAMKYG